MTASRQSSAWGLLRHQLAAVEMPPQPRSSPSRAPRGPLRSGSSPVNQRARAFQHPEIHKKPPPRPPSAEELDRFDDKEDFESERRAEAAGRGQPVPINPVENRERAEFLKRARETGVSDKLKPRTQP